MSSNHSPGRLESYLGPGDRSPILSDLRAEVAIDLVVAGRASRRCSMKPRVRTDFHGRDPRPLFFWIVVNRWMVSAAAIRLLSKRRSLLYKAALQKEIAPFFLEKNGKLLEKLLMMIKGKKEINSFTSSTTL